MKSDSNWSYLPLHWSWSVLNFDCTNYFCLHKVSKPFILHSLTQERRLSPLIPQTIPEFHGKYSWFLPSGHYQTDFWLSCTFVLKCNEFSISFFKSNRKFETCESFRRSVAMRVKTKDCIKNWDKNPINHSINLCYNLSADYPNF